MCQIKQIIFQVLSSSIYCTTDYCYWCLLHCLEGHGPEGIPLCLIPEGGHGIVESVGEGVTSVQLGETVRRGTNMAVLDRERT